MVLCVEFPDGRPVRSWHLTADGARADSHPDYTPSMLVNHRNTGWLDTAASHLASHPHVVATDRVPRRPTLRDGPTEMLRVDITTVGAVQSVARALRDWGAPGEYRLFDVDLSPEFRFCLETGTDSMPSPTRELRVCRLETAKAALATDPLGKLTVDGTELTIPDEMIHELQTTLEEKDPDVLVLSHAELAPRLFDLASSLGVDDFQLGRCEGYTQRAQASTYESYGQVGHSPARYSVPGRVIINEQNAFVWGETNLDGCLDLVDRSGKPLQELGWASIGNVLTAIQIREGRCRGVHSPWSSWRHEGFKTAATLDDADRGGFTFAPDVGVHEDVHELDFASMFPTVMVTRNISPETVRCECHDTDDVPGLGYSICSDRGFLPDVLEPIIDAREAIKAELGEVPPDESDRIAELEGRSGALKWILVSRFGYQGFKNAKFGRIECHEAINAFAREILLDAKETLEAHGWRVVHGIVDSLWVVAREGVDQAPLSDVAAKVSEDVGIRLEYETGYDWLAFVPQRNRETGALTKYFGRRRGGEYTIKGIESRQRSTPEFVAETQRTLLETFDVDREPEAICDHLAIALSKLRTGGVDSRKLLIKQWVSKPASEYGQRTRAVAALERAADQGLGIAPGESVEYLVVDDDKRSTERVRLAHEVGPTTSYDTEAYRTELVRAATSLVAPLGWEQHDVERYLADRIDATIQQF